MVGQVAANFWTDEQTDLLKDCVLRQRLSFAESAIKINEQFGTAYTRNAVIGRAHRIELVSPTRARLPHKPRKPQPYKPRPPRERSVTKIVEGGLGGRRVQSTDVAEIGCVEIECLVPFADVTGCWYPTGDGPFLFCDSKKLEGTRYCATHIALCTKQSKPARESGFRERAA